MTFELRLQELTQSFTTEAEQQQLFHPFSTVVREGARIACIGESGQGKSSLLKIMARLTLPTAGSMLWNGQPSSTIPLIDWRKSIHYVGQHAVMLPGTVEANLRLSSSLHKQDFARQHAEQLMASIGLKELDWQADASELSGGEKQRVALVRSLLLNPKILLLDEVTASLDAFHTNRVEELLLNWAREQPRAYIWITHQQDQAKRIANEHWRFQNHHIVIEQLEVAQ